jgi:hypothetical protein
MTKQAITQANLAQARTLLDANDPKRIQNFYNYIASFGYDYPRLALGVVREDSINGIVALNYMQVKAEQKGVSIDVNFY